jgi:hypothetical protein
MQVKSSHTGLALLGIILLIPLTIIISAILNGWALSILWEWFVVPIFNIQKISTLQAIGLSLIVGYFTATTQSKKKDDEKKELVISNLITLSLKPLFAVFFGWIVVQFM